MERPSMGLIIPTHNRKDSLEQLLHALSRQTYPMDLIEVIVVADGCIDSTIQMLETIQPAYKLRFIDQPASGPATARNNGAAMANSKILLFLDDDIIPSEGLLEAHVMANTHPNMVVIGYLPLVAQKKRDSFFMQSRSWWEEKYYKMQNPSYRYSYQDLLSGNFSISSDLFHLTGGFDKILRCREDYEFGLRLIQHGAQLIFCRKAWGYHNDTHNNRDRAWNRKRQEGKFDVRLGFLHPRLIQTLPLAGFENKGSLKKFILVVLIFWLRRVNQIIFSLLGKLLTVFETLKLRSTLYRLNYKLNQLWYFKGVADELKSAKELHALLQSGYHYKVQNEKYLEVNIGNGLTIVEQQIDAMRPIALDIWFGPYSVGKILWSPEAENLRGAHLRAILAKGYALPLIKILALNTVANSNNDEANKFRV